MLAAAVTPLIVLGIAHCGTERTTKGPVVAVGANGSAPAAMGSTPPPADASARFKSVCVGYLHTCATTEAGVAYCWGVLKSEIDKPPVYAAVPTRVRGIDNADQIACSFTRTCVRRKDGSVSCWDLSNPDKVVAIEMKNTVDLVGAEGGVCAIGKDGNVACWTDANTPPVLVEANADRFVPALSEEVCFLGRDKRPMCILPFPTKTYRAPAPPSAVVRPRPAGSAWTHLAPIASLAPQAQPLMAMSDVADFALWLAGPCVLRTDGSMQCSDPSMTQELGKALGNRRVQKFLSSSPEQLCVRTTDGETRCARWGRSQLGGVQPNLGPVQSFSARATHACAVRDDGSALCWGETRNGQLGDGVLTVRTKPFAVGIDDAIDLAVEENRSCAIRKGGSLWCWGSEGDRCAQGESTKPVPIKTPLNATRVFVGPNHSAMNVCVGDDQGSWSCRHGSWYSIPAPPSGMLQLSYFTILGNDGLMWRLNLSKQPPILDPDYFAKAGVRLTSVSPFAECGVDQAGHIVCGQDNGYEPPKKSLRKVPSPSSFVQVTSLLAQGEDAGVCGRTRQGKVECWGSPGMPLRAGTPVQKMAEATAGLKDVVDLAGGFSDSASAACAVAKDGKVLCWGDNTKGQVGDGTLVARAQPTQVADLPPTRRVAVSGAHVCALTTTGSVYCWGNDRCGEVGTGVAAIRATAAFRPPKE